MSGLFMETTKISPAQTIAEIQKILVKYGAKSIQVEYEGEEVKSVAFIIELGERRLPFALPARWEPLFKVIHGERRRHAYRDSVIADDTAKAKRVAWRQVLRWVEAQLALVSTKMVRIEEVFMPYLVVGAKGQTLFQKMQDDQFLLESK